MNIRDLSPAQIADLRAIIEAYGAQPVAAEAVATPSATPAVNPWKADSVVRWVDKFGGARNAAGATIDGAQDPLGLLAVYAANPGHPVFTREYPKSAKARAKHPDAQLWPPATVAPTAAPTAAPTLRGKLLAQIAPAPTPAPAPTADPVASLLADVARVRAMTGSAADVLAAMRMIHDHYAVTARQFTHSDIDMAFGLRDPRAAAAK